MFKNIVLSAAFVGVIVGAIMGVMQHYTTTPIILAAEVFEISQPEIAPHGHDGQASSDHHAKDAWSPEDGLERMFFTLLSSIVTAIGFAMLLLAAMAASEKIKLWHGLAFGFAGYISFFVAPSFGLAPEIPGTVAAQLEGRQGWWLLCVILTAAGLGVLAFIKQYYRFFGLALIAIPHILGAPTPEHHGFANTDPEAVAALTNLTNEFLIMTAISLLIFWVLLGVVSSFAANKFWQKIV